MKFFFNCLTIFSFISFSLENYISQEKNKWYKKIIESLKDILIEFSNETCYEELQKKINYIYLYSDTDIISDFNKETECIEKNLTYFLFYYELSKNVYLNESKEKEILKFLNNNNFTTGICIPSNCSIFIEKNLFNNTKNLINESIINFLNTSINTSTLHYIKNEKNKQNNEKKYRSVIICFIIYIIFRILITIRGECIYQQDKDDLIKIIPHKEIEKENEEESSQTFTENSSNEIDNNINSNEEKSKSKSNMKDDLFDKSNKSFIYEVKEKKGFYFYFNIFRNIGIYNSKNEMKWFRDENLELVNLFRSFFLFLCVLDYQIYTTFKHPTRDFFNRQFYTDLNLIFIKFISFSTICYVTLDGFLLSFKFLNFYKHYCIERKKLISEVFYKFIIMCIPKIILYYSNFYLVHYFVLDFINFFFKLNAWQEYHFIDHSSIKCFSNEHWKYIFNFYSFSFNSLSNKFNDCHKIFFIYQNEFVMLLFFIILFCILLHFKSKILEAIILFFIFFPLIIYSIFFIDKLKNEDIYDRNLISGEIYTLKYIYLFTGIYFIGILTGIGYFNYVDSISPSHVNDYIPFNFINKFSQLLYDISNLFKIILISFILLCVIIISSSYSFYHIINGSNNEDQITFKIPLFLKYLYFYDKIIIVLLFNLLLLTLLVMGETSFSKIGGLSLICFISRNGFTIFASYDYFIKIFYIVFEYQYCLSLSDNIFIAFGEFAFIIFLSCLFNVLFELPFRMILIGLTKPKNFINQKENKMNKLINI